jgi:hypothetical protein
MPLRPVQLIAIISAALYLVPTAAHLFEMPNKLRLPAGDYMVAQKLYAGWSAFGIVIVIAIGATLLNAIMVRGDRRAFRTSLTALIALSITQVVFWSFTYPMNIASANWTVLPEPFEASRRQWEYSHAISAVMTFVALMAITISALTYRDQSATRQA